MSSRFGAAIILVICVLSSVQAQIPMNPAARRMAGNAQQQQQHANMQPTEIQGTLQGVMHGRIAVLDSNNQNWQVAIPANAKIEVTGTLSADSLQAGTVVEFKAEIDDHGALKEKVGELSIVSLSADKQLGVTSDTDLGGDQGGFGDAGDKKKTKTAKRKPAAGKKLTAGSYRIIGKLTVGHGGKLAVLAGKTQLALQLADDAKISIESSDYSLASKGDQVTVKGLMLPNRPGMAQATDVKIELSGQAATSPAKKKPAKGEAKKPAKKPAKAEGDEQ
jgi:hypothetical protein